MVKVAINGFGRIGRLAFRQMFEAEGYEVVAINDLTSPKMLAHLLKYDTAQGGFAGKFGEGKHTVEATENSIIVDGKEITIYAKPNAAELPWGELGVDVVLECTGFYTSKEKASAHLTAGAKKVVISAPARKPQHFDSRRQDYLCCFLHNKLPCSYGCCSPRIRSNPVRYHVNYPRLHW